MAFYSYRLQEDLGVIAALFETKTSTWYRAYFYPASEYIIDPPDGFDDNSILIRDGYFFGLTKLAPNEERIEALDTAIQKTVLLIIDEFFESMGVDKVLIFHCDGEDGRKEKRSKCFDRWFMISDSTECFRKYDEEIVTTDVDGTRIDTDFLSIIVQCDNPNTEALKIEFNQLKISLIAGKQ